MAARPTTDVFRPCLPVDPFAGVEPGPWNPSISPQADPPAAVLILGDPDSTDLHPILSSQSLVNSLIVIVTHAPPHIPQTPLPAVRIIRLATSLAQDASALRLVGLLQRAGRVVRRSRADVSRKLVQLAENTLTGEFDVEEIYSASPPRMKVGDIIPRYPSPTPSATSSLSSASSLRSSLSTSSTSSSSISRRRRAHVSSSQPPPDRAFDAIINFLPSSLPDKLLLKHAILVSTLSASFVATPTPPIPSTQLWSSNANPPEEKKSRRFSTFLRRSPPTQSTPDIHDQSKGKSRSQLHLNTCVRKPHLVHVLPPHVYHYQPMGARGSSKKPQQQKSPKAGPKPKLVQSIEQFLLAFGYPLQSMSLLPSSASNSSIRSKRISVTSTTSSTVWSPSASFNPAFGTDATGEKPIPFLLPTGVLGSTPAGGRLSIGEILLMGGFDRSAATGMESALGEEGITGMDMEEGRVWIGCPDDVIWDDDLENLSTSPALNPPLRDSTLHIPPPTHSRARPTRSSSLPIPGPHEPSSAAVKPPPSAQLAPLKPIPTKHLSLPSSSLSPLSPSPLSPPVPAHTPNGKSTKSNLLSRAKSKRSSNPLPLSPSETIVPQELRHKQLPTPPESASSLEDGGNGDDDDDDDDRMTSETTIADTGSLPSFTASATDHHHLSSRYLQSQDKGHRAKAASTLGHGHASTEAPGDGGGKNLKGFMARFGLGLGKLRVRVGRN